MRNPNFYSNPSRHHAGSHHRSAAEAPPSPPALATATTVPSTSIASSFLTLARIQKR
ncbi:hypothetical protein DEO72_LG3g1665 [Vigna unguiculata]|uniref:Uncharacterized protein n=1 Tax=Vigna unguiculata TaxID=3917 RepID=A0A4D6LEV9_VIGUN|nr:hypothetical protein DEO72_LG3g1665 [Vigna unguiculata]